MSEPTSLNAFSYVTLVVFLFVIALVIRPIKVRVGRFGKIYLNIATAPPLGVLILLICQAIGIDIVKQGLAGTMGVQPWAIMILFYSLAYICISLDMTGVFQFCAFWVSRKAGSRGMLAFTLFFLLTSFMSGLTSNDVVILTGTVFLSYFTKVSDIRPTAFLMSEFTTANIASMALYIGNPTNVVVAEAYGISFINYSAWMLLPTVICIILSYVVLRVLFRGEYYLPRKIQPPEADPKSVLIDPKGAIFGLVLLACCLATLIGTSFANVPVWMITLPYAVAMLVRDIRHDLGISFSKMFRLKPQQPRPVFHNPTSIDEAISHGIQALPLETLHGQDSATTIPTTMDQIATSSSGGLSHNPLSTATEKEMENQQAPTIITQIEETIVQRQSQDISRLSNSHHSYQSTIIDRTKGNQNSGLLGAYEKTVGVIVQVVMKGWHWFCDRFPTISAVTKRMPWTILPFSLGMFVLIEALAHVGWVSIFATAMSVFAKNYATAVLGMVFVSIIACQILNNLPMTILFTQIIQHPNFTDHVHSDVVMQGFLLGLIVGSNLGACLTLVGSLAGIMFDHILKTKGIYTLGYFQFLKWNLVILPVLAAGASAVIIGELWYVYIR